MTAELRELMTSAADDAPPHDLAGRAVAGARRRRQGRLAVAGAIAAVTALVAGAVVLGPLQRTSDEPRPQDVASLPAELPGVDGLPELTAGTMDAASVGYVIDETLVLVDAATGDAFVWSGFPVPEDVESIPRKTNRLRPYQVRLSPDGATALVAMRYDTSQRLLGTPLALLDLPSAQATRIEDMYVAGAYGESAWLEYSLMAWTPDSGTAYCVCLGGDGTDPELGVWSITTRDAATDVSYSQVSDLDPSQISVGAVGLVVQLEPMGGAWSLLGGESDVEPVAPAADALAVSLADPSASAWTRDGRYTVTSDSDLYPQVVSGPLPAGPVSSVQALGDDEFVVVSRPGVGLAEPPPPLLAHILTKGVDPELITTFPADTTSTSFAAEVGANR